MAKKYKLTEESIIYFGKTLYRIEALKDFANVKKGDKGGYVQSDENLSQEGNCWISDNAIVYDYALVSGNAKVSGYTLVYDNAQVCDKAIVAYNAKVFDNAQVCGNAQVSGSTKIYGNAEVFGNAYVCGDAVVCGDAKVFGNAVVYDNAGVFGDALVYGNVEISGSAEIKNNSDYIVFKNWWSSGRYFTWTRSNNMWKVGCFYGTGEELIAKAYKDSEISGREYKRVVGYVETILQDTE